jgi:hypothetical protein
MAGNHTQMDEVQSGTSVMSQGDMRLHFGLGQAKTVDRIEVKWPTTQKVEKFTSVAANQILTIKEEAGITNPQRIRSGYISSACRLWGPSVRSPRPAFDRRNKSGRDLHGRLAETKTPPTRGIPLCPLKGVES